MDEELMFRILFVALYGIFAGVRVYYRSKTLGREKEEERTLRNIPMIGLFLAILGYIALVILYILIPDLIAWGYIPIPTVIRWAGVFIGLFSAFLVYRVHRSLGRQYSAGHEIQLDHQLITVGPYSRVRHPMYTILNLFSVSMSLISSNLLMIIFAVLVIIPFPWLVKREEQMMIDQFGDEYREYMERTGRFFPRIRQ